MFTLYLSDYGKLLKGTINYNALDFFFIHRSPFNYQATLEEL
ncbi:hypothetical protein [Psychromonas ingrahamii]|nr:hypothetical protein [Psychromonas ingrahamii]